MARWSRSLNHRGAEFLVAAAIFLAGCSPESRFLQRHVTIHGRTYRYRVWLPAPYTRAHRWPVILYLHGSGERGDDNLRQLTLGLPAALTHYPQRYRAIVVIPQCRLNAEWYGEMEEQALAALDATVKEFRGDQRRVYLTGISMGGAGVWYFARNAARFAAIVPVCGEVVRQPDDPFPLDPPPEIASFLHSANPFAALAGRIGKLPVWAFHGARDEVIPVTQSRWMVSALKARGGNVRYTEYALAGHDVWDLAYAEKELPKWLLRQRR